MDEYFRVVQHLPQGLGSELAALNTKIAPHVQEIRLRAGQPVLFTMKGRLRPATKFLPGARRAARLDHPALQDCFLQLCRHSAFAYEEELRQGYFTIAGGNRVGVAGSWGPGGFSAVTSLNLRIARWVTCDLPPEVLGMLTDPAGGILVAGPPGSGKTTFLRSMVSWLGQSDLIVCVVDERSELMAGQASGLPQSRSMHCDVYTRHPKARAISMALRCMNPQIIVCDELGTAEDAEALRQGIASGAVFLASVHCDKAENLHKKPQLQPLLETGAFQTAVFLDGRERPGTVVQMVDLA